MKRLVTIIVALICTHGLYLLVWIPWVGTDSESTGMYIMALIVVCTNIILAKIEKKDSGK